MARGATTARGVTTATGAQSLLFLSLFQRRQERCEATVSGGDDEREKKMELQLHLTSADEASGLHQTPTDGAPLHLKQRMGSICDQ
ncbi:hypothetical protein Q3G72_032473 [Acer saccharum]|nr:hypothetical protein Q3G72_032473 [Acer saccharum]